MKAAILTFQFADNYGAMLQAYALKEYLTKKGAQVTFIDYTPDKERVFYSLNPFAEKGLKKIIKKSIQVRKRVHIHKRFQLFRKSNLNVPSGIKYAPDKLADEFDVIIVGSDQVWNKKIVGNISPYFLKGVPEKCIKASYAASMSIVDKKDIERGDSVSLLKKFDFLSVREDSARVLLEKYGLTVKTVVDPVFLLTASDWRGFGTKPKAIKEDEKYAVIYLLREDERCVKEAEIYTEKYNIKLYYIHPLNNKLKSKRAKLIKNTDPREFVWLIENADAVFTNSFHATSFSMIFEKKLKHILKKELGARVPDLLGVADIKECGDGCVTASCENSLDFKKRKSLSVEYIDNVINAAKLAGKYDFEKERIKE